MSTVLVNPDTGLAEELSEDLANQSVQSGTHQIPLNDPEGNPVSVPYSEAQDRLSKGYTQPTTEQLQNLLSAAKNSSLSEQLKAGAEGAGSALTLGLSTGVERALGVKPEDIQRRAKTGAHTAGEIAGLVGSAFIPGLGEASAARVMEGAGAAGARALGLGAEGAGLLSNIGAAATRGAIETAIMQAGSENSKFLSGDPNQSTETALADIGMAALLGGAISAPFGTLPSIVSTAKASKVGKFIDDFKGRVKSRIDNPNPVESLRSELENLHGQMDASSKLVYGESGLKAEEVRKLLPEMNERIVNKVDSITKKLDDTLEKMKSDAGDYPDSLVKKLEGKIEDLKSSTKVQIDPLTNQVIHSPTSDEVYLKLDSLKKQFNEWGRFNKDMVPLAERDFRNAAKSLGHDLRTSLEDTAVWGKAGARQAEINKAFSEYLPKLKDFQSKFMTKVEGEFRIDPTKINTYMNQLGKPNAELKQEMLQNFIEASQKYKKAIEDSHTTLGLQSPFSEMPVNQALASLEKKSTGAKIADYLMDKGAAQAMAGTVGSVAGSAVGHPFIGGLLGERLLTRSFEDALPVIYRGLLDKTTSAEGLKSAIKLTTALDRGERALSRGAKAIFLQDSSPLIPLAASTEKNNQKLDEQIKEFRTNPDALFSVSGQTSHYMPDHAMALSTSVGRVVQYLDSIRPNTEALGLLDKKRTPSQAEKSRYDKALTIANKPMVVLSDIKKGTLTSNDVVDLKSMYPALYSRMTQKLMDELISSKSKDQAIPYKTKLSLSLFMAQPLDSTMTPASIMGAQVLKLPQSQQQLPQNQPKRSMKDLGNMIPLYQTPSQSRAEAKAVRR